MALSTELINAFVKATNDKTDNKQETTLYGTVSITDGVRYVTLDGSSEITPVSSLVTISHGDRVKVTIKDHRATVVGNLSSASASSADVIEISKKAETLNASKVDTTDLDAVVGRVQILETNSATIKNLEAAEARIYELETDNLTVTETLTAQDAVIKTLETETLKIETAAATYATIEELDVTNAAIYNLETTYGDFEVLTTNNFEATQALIDNLQADKLSADIAQLTYAKITDLDAALADINVLETDIASIDTLIFGSASGNVIQSSFSNAVIAQLGDAQIKAAMIESLTADKITAGDILTDKVRVKSQNGLLLISDETIQIGDGARVRVQIGKDASSDYSINIWDADGNLMFSKGGITDSAIKDAIIRNDMVSDTANIAAHKLNIDSLFEEINGSANVIKSTQIYLDDQAQTLNVAFKELETEVSDLGSTVSSQGTQLSVVQGQIASKIWQQDIDTATGELSTQYSVVEQQIDSINASIASHETDVGNLKQRLSSAETAIEMNTTDIELRVTRQELESTAEQLAISGRNLIVRRGELIDTYVVASGEITPSDSSYKSATIANAIPVTPGETYTFSKTEGLSAYCFRWAWFDKDMNVIGRTYNEATTFQWTAPANATYIIVSYPYIDGANAKLEKGDVATEYCPSIEDMANVVDEKLAKYPTTLEMEAAIELSEDSIVSSVSKTYTTKTEFNSLEIGACNLIKNSNFAAGLSKWVPVGTTCTVEEDDAHGTCVKVVSAEVGSSSSRLYPSTTDNFVHTGGKYTLSFYAKAEADTTMQSNVAGGTSGVCNYNLTTTWQKYVHTYDASAGSITFWSNEANTTIYLTKIKLEHGTKATDWTPAPDDMATENDVKGVQTNVDILDERVVTTETLIRQLTDSISMLVTDGNGTSLMTQTESGWTFSTSEIQTAIASAAESLNNLNDELGNTNNTVEVLQQAVADLGEIAEYVKIGTLEDEPCIELGEGDSEFKLRITNTRMLFMEGSSVIAHFTNQSLHIKKAVIEEELQQGEFVWKVRANGNLGLVWKGVSS